MEYKTYHKNKGFPSHIVFPTDVHILKYTNHAKKRARIRYGDLYLPSFIDTNNAQVIDIRVINGEHTIYNALYRTTYNKRLDILLAVAPQPNNIMLVKTIWLNGATDHHKNLDLKKYDLP